MYVLQFLEKAGAKSAASAEAVEVEYRLACSGELYNRNVQTSDWRKSSVTRAILQTPFELFVASQPFDDYPQELSIRLTLDYVTERAEADKSSFSSTFLPDDDVIEDLCSILSLLSRRLITPIAKTREQHKTDTIIGTHGTDIPIPILRRSRVTAWKRRPATIITGMQTQQIIEHDPPPLGVHAGALAEVLTRLATLADAKQIILAARLYRTAMELIETRPDIAYQLLISTVETFAGIALAEYQPEDSEKLETKRNVFKRALRYGLCQEQATDLALLACQGLGWNKRKFIKFLSDRVSPADLTSKDSVFLVPHHLCPSPADLEKVLSHVYAARSGSLHSGSSLPRSIGIGTSPSIHFRSLPLNPLEPDDVPPVPWFERVVFLAVQKFLLDQTAVKTLPFL